MKQKIVIIGAGGFGREVLDVFDACNKINDVYDVLGFIVEAKYGKRGQIINDKPILGDIDWFKDNHEKINAICGVGAPEHRLQLITKAKKYNVRFCNIIHPSAILTSRVKIGEGVVITAGCILTNQIQIGDHVHINLIAPLDMMQYLMIFQHLHLVSTSQAGLNWEKDVTSEQEQIL
jgi:NDP-sugar pyrophosphorylase family protein